MIQVVDVRSIFPPTKRTPVSLLEVEEGADCPMKLKEEVCKLSYQLKNKYILGALEQYGNMYHAVRA